MLVHGLLQPFFIMKVKMVSIEIRVSLNMLVTKMRDG